MESRNAEQSNLPATIPGSNGTSTNVLVPISSVPSPQELLVYQTWAQNAFDSQMYRGVGKQSAIMMIMLAAREYGIGPAQALNGGLHIIEGKVELSARIMSALIRRAKHTLKILETTDQKCVIYGKRCDTGEEHTVTFTIEMAQKAGLIKEKGGWKRTPEDMLYARCISRLARQLFSDVIGIGYVEGEIIAPGSNVEVLELSQESESNDEALVAEEFYRNFNPLQSDLVNEFVQAFAKHYKITVCKAMKELLKDMKLTLNKFNEWKEKRNPNE